MNELQGLQSSQALRLPGGIGGGKSARDRRDSYRLDLPAGLTQIHAPYGAELVLKDVSATGGSLVVRGRGIEGRDRLPAVIQLEEQEAFSTELQIVRVARPDEGITELGARFRALTTTGRRTLSRFMIREVNRRGADVARLVEGTAALRITNPAVISNLFRPSAGTSAQALQVVDGVHRLPGRLEIVALESDGRSGLVRTAPALEELPLEAGREYTFLLPGPGAVTLFRSRISARSEGHVFIEIPGEVLQTGFRESTRTPVSGAETGFAFSITRAPDQRLRGRLRDVAAHGLSMMVEDERGILFPGDRLARICLNLNEGRVEASGVIRSIVPQSEGRGLQCGVELVDFSGREAERRWHRFVFRQMHPRLHQAERNDVPAAWTVLKTSSYVNLWVDQEEQKQIESSFAGDWKASTPETGSMLLLQNERGPVGMISGSLLYPRTWLMHHLGVDEQERTKERKKEFFSMADELYSGITYSLRHVASARYFVAYFERNKGWNQFLYQEFIERYVRKEDQLYEPRNVYRRRTDAPVAAEACMPGGGRIVLGDEPLLAQLGGLLRDRLPAMEVDAFSYGNGEIGLGAFGRKCAAHGAYERRRDIYFALDAAGAPLAALVAEAGGEGVNIFGLLNACWIVPFSDALDPAVARALLDQAVRHYRGLGKRGFVLFEVPGMLGEAPRDLGFEFVSDGIRWLARTEVLPVWRNYVADSISARQSGTAITNQKGTDHA